MTKTQNERLAYFQALYENAKNAYQDVSKQTKDVVNGLGKAAKGMFDAFVSGM